MTLLTALYNAYNYCAENGFVDMHSGNDTVLLPLYHSNLRSTGDNIIKIRLDTNSRCIGADLIPNDTYIVFPVTENSISRSGKIPPPHPLVDKAEYIDKNLDKQKNEAFVRELEKWVAFDAKETHNPLLAIIYTYYRNADISADILRFAFKGKDPVITEGGKLEYTDTGAKKEIRKSLSYADIFITYEVCGFDGVKNTSVTDNIELHKDYIKYVEYCNEANKGKTSYNICNIANKKMYLSGKHRGIIGNAKMISVSNNKQTYIGRFSDESHVFSIGYQTSQKIHLMLKYFIENENTSRWIGSSQYMVNWFSDDIFNVDGIDVISGTDFDESEETDEYGGGKIAVHPASLAGKEYGKHAVGLEASVSSDSFYYIAILDKINNGRVAVKYFRAMPKSDLMERTAYWYKTCSWTGGKGEMHPSLFSIMDCTFGTERDGKIICDKDDFKKNTICSLIPCIIEGEKIPLNIVKKMYQNISSRHRYKDCWNLMVVISCAVFKKYYFDYGKNKAEVTGVVELKEQDRSYLFGRMLALFELAELSVYATASKKADDLQNADKEIVRSTNALKLWSRYIGAPEKTALQLTQKINPYLQKLRVSRPAWYIKYDVQMTEIVSALEILPEHNSKKNSPLEENFIFGYYGQKQLWFAKKQDANIQEEE